MHIKILAFDLDGTLATDDSISETTWAALEAAKEAGFLLILVTGRMLDVLSDIAPFEELFEAIVGENGAAIFFPRTETVSLPFGHLDPEVISNLEQRPIPLERGMAIAATWTPHDKEVLNVLSKTGYAATVEYNKGAVMVLPPGTTKGSGLLFALKELGYSPHNVVACGDAENDLSLFEQAELAVAVANAVPILKSRAEIVLEQSNGIGIQFFLNGLVNNELPPFNTRPERRISFGQNKNGDPLLLSPFYFIGGNLGIFGKSGSGKSWLAGLLAEKLLQQNYQVCIIDPEGDYRSFRAFPQFLLLGGEHSSLPSVGDVTTLIEYSNTSLILDLSLKDLDKQISYVTDLMNGLRSLRNRRGKPHWFLIDEIHYFCPEDNKPLTKLMKTYIQRGGFGLISYQPSLIAPSILSEISQFLLTRISNPQELAILHQLFSKQMVDDAYVDQISSLTGKQAFLYLDPELQKDVPDPGIIEFNETSRQVPHVRHLHKYLHAPLPENKRFYFNLQGDVQGPSTAASLCEFSEVLYIMPVKTLQFHLENGDFERWLQGTLHDNELARRIRKIKNRKLKGDLLREALSSTVAARFEELERLI